MTSLPIVKNKIEPGTTLVKQNLTTLTILSDQ